MNWQEYQEAVGKLYKQMEGIGRIHQNITMLDKITGQPRQVDTLLEIQERSHTIKILIDAKFRKEKLDVKDIEEVYALGSAVGASKCVIVASSEFTSPAVEKANHFEIDIRILSIEDALELMVPDKWMMCPNCKNDCIVMEFSGGVIKDRLWSIFITGRCRQCQTGLFWCFDCGQKHLIRLNEKDTCACGHDLKNDLDGISVKFENSKIWMSVNETTALSADDIENILGFPSGWTDV